MSRVKKIKDTIEAISKKSMVKESTDQEEISELESNFSTLEGLLRGYIQEITKDKILTIVDKLKNNESLSQEELNCIELWIVGDAEYYTKLEDNFKDNIKEVNKILYEIQIFLKKEVELDLEICNKLRALARDGLRAISDIDYFVSQRARVAKFKESTVQIDEEERETLIDILINKLKSENF